MPVGGVISVQHAAVLLMCSMYVYSMYDDVARDESSQNVPLSFRRMYKHARDAPPPLPTDPLLYRVYCFTKTTFRTCGFSLWLLFVLGALQLGAKPDVTMHVLGADGKVERQVGEKNYRDV